jgi:uncharacterized protein YdaU (DUF1376 family)
MTQTSLPWVKWYFRDFASSTQGWPAGAVGAYYRLLGAQWDQGALPAGSAELRSLSGATSAEWRKAWPLIEPKLPIGPDGRRRNLRMEEDRDVALKNYASRLGVSKKANEARWSDASRNPSRTESSSIKESIKEVSPILEGIPSRSRSRARYGVESKSLAKGTRGPEEASESAPLRAKAVP